MKPSPPRATRRYAEESPDSAQAAPATPVVIDETVRLELVEMQKLGMKVVLPDACQIRPEVPTQPVLISAPSRDLAPDWSDIDTCTVEDWIDLEELGGSPPWPNGMTTRVAIALVRERKKPSL